MSSTYDFTGRVALITGSSSGIGAAIAILLAKAGARVVITGRNYQKLAAVYKQCSDVSPHKCRPAVQVVADVTKEVDMDRLLAITIDTFGQLDILVNNVGFLPSAPISSNHYMKNFRSVMDTNLDSIVYLTHKSVQYLAKTKGSIINMSSILAKITCTPLSSYCMSKAALDMFTKCLAVELGPKGIRVNSVNPGSIYTDLLENGFGITGAESRALFDRVAANYPVGRMGEGMDVANAVAYLASDQGSFITGTHLFVDGGHIAANISIEL